VIVRSSWMRRATAGKVARVAEVIYYEGNCQSYIEDLKRRQGADAGRPHRSAYKKLVHA
jgi:hypothetical protein